MKGKIGTHMRYKGYIVPRSGTFKRLGDSLVTKEAEVRLKWMDFYQKTGNGRLTCRHFGISPDTFYRWKRRYLPFHLNSLEDVRNSRRPKKLRTPATPENIVLRIKALREEYPRWGKEKLTVLLRHEGLTVSVSTVGRTLTRLRRRGLLIEPRLRYISGKKRFLRRAWGIRKPTEYENLLPGDLVEIDTLDVRPIPGVVRKQFTARDTISKWDVLEVYGSATSGRATVFLDTLLTRMPFKVKALQIDGGSEFKGEFELECQRRGLKLFVLPPRSPKLNGCVERSNRTHTEEFYEVRDFPLGLQTLNTKLKDWEKVYNTVRPHQALHYLTPKEYLESLVLAKEGVRDVLN